MKSIKESAMKFTLFKGSSNKADARAFPMNFSNFILTFTGPFQLALHYN